MNSVIEKLKEFMENEARSCSMDFRCVTPEYVYRMCGGTVTFNAIKEAFMVHGARLTFHGYFWFTTFG